MLFYVLLFQRKQNYNHILILWFSPVVLCILLFYNGLDAGVTYSVYICNKNVEKVKNSPPFILETHKEVLVKWVIHLLYVY